MAQKMLIDATHPEETRVVVADGNKVEEFDFESINKRQLAGNIYLAKVTRVEPSLQAAFVDYGGNRHGFLAFAEIHPDYYQIPVADREKLLAEQAAAAEAEVRAEEEEESRKPVKRRSSRRRSRSRRSEGTAATEGDPLADPRDAEAGADAAEPSAADAPAEAVAEAAEAATTPEAEEEARADDRVAAADDGKAASAEDSEATAPETPDAPDEPGEDGTPPKSIAARSEHTDDLSISEDAALTADAEAADVEVADAGIAKPAPEAAATKAPSRSRRRKTPAAKTAAPAEKTEEDRADTAEAGNGDGAEAEEAEEVESIGAEDMAEEIAVRRPMMRRYKIQEVIKVRQILLVQVVKEERGNKGAALTTYLSLPGRYCVLMPNTARGGGISRKITNAASRKKLRAIADELEVPKGAGLIIRTAGSERTKSEIKRDYDFLLRQWDEIRTKTLQSIAPTLIYEEGSLIKRAIRDLYNKNIDEVLVEGEAGYREARDYMKMLMPSHARHVKHYTDPIPLFSRYQVESYLASLFNPVVQLKSGGYIVIGVTEALVAIDVNSGRATREHSIEETALKTNLEAADEVARQLRLRDLAGLIVIDFIDMDERRNNAAVEKRMKERLKSDRARIQIGRISAFGLMEMSRQRLRPGMLEAITAPCPHCHGTGLIRSDESLALTILRELEEEGVRQRAREVLVAAPVGVANYLINQKREAIGRIETRYRLSVRVEADPALVSPDYRMERFKTASRVIGLGEESTTAVTAMSALPVEEIETAEPPAEAAESGEDTGSGRKKRRRRRRRGGGGSEAQQGETEGRTESPTEAGAAPEEARPEPGPVEAEAVDEVARPAGSEEAAAAETPIEAPAEAPVEAAVEAAVEKPKRTRRRSRSSRRSGPADAMAVIGEGGDPTAPLEIDGSTPFGAVEAEVEPEAAAEAEPAAEPAAEAATPAQAPEAVDETAAAVPAETAVETDIAVADEPAVEAVAETPAPAEPVEIAIETARTPEAAEAMAAEAETVSAEAGEAQPGGTAEAATATESAAAAEGAQAEESQAGTPPRRRRRGWWSLGQR